MSKCNPEYARKYREAHKEQRNEYMKKYFKLTNNGGIKGREGRLRRRYGITPEYYDVMFSKQDGRCAICGISQAECNRALEIDHDHNTGVVRGLLCRNCNLLLGRAHDDIQLLNKAIGYLSLPARVQDMQDNKLAINMQKPNRYGSFGLSNNTSGARGVSWEKRRKKWRALIYFKGEGIHLGYFDNIEDAARSYEDARKHYKECS